MRCHEQLVRGVELKIHFTFDPEVASVVVDREDAAVQTLTLLAERVTNLPVHPRVPDDDDYDDDDDENNSQLQL